MPVSSSASRPQDYPGGPLAGIEFQRHWERQAFIAGGWAYLPRRPAQLVWRISWRERASTKLGSRRPVLPVRACTPTDLSSCLPELRRSTAIREAIPAIERQVPRLRHGRCGADRAWRRAPPHRCASAARQRFPERQYAAGCYPAGEGAGFAGGILSAGVDGIRIAEAVALDLLGRGGEAEMSTGSGSYA